MNPAPYPIEHNASLAERTTLRLRATASEWHELTTVDAVCTAWLNNGPPDLILGGGSNIVINAERVGVVWHPAIRGRQILAATDDALCLRVGAGETWDDVVAWSLAEGGCGLENLSAIPGLSGAAPLQNIGAYGVELDEFIDSVETLDLLSGAIKIFEKNDCDFAYRHSRFRGADRGRYLILALNLRLPRGKPPKIEYPGIAEELERLGIDVKNAGSDGVRRAVLAIRRRKLPDLAVWPNAGSFFKNPIIDSALASALQERWPKMPAWPAAGKTKLSAAWLIEAVGFKGKRQGTVGVSAQHALVLVNHGGASGAELLALARRVQDAVYQRFALELEIEPVVYPDIA